MTVHRHRHRDRHRHRLRRGDERGQLTIMVIAFTAIASLMLVVVVVSTKAFLTRRALSSYADGAAVTAAQSIDEAAIYGGSLGTVTPLSQQRAAAAVADYAAANGLRQHFRDFRIRSVVVTGPGVVRVEFAAVSPVPFVNEVTRDFAGGVPVSVAATARSAVE